MTSLSLQCISVRRNVFMFVFIIFNIGLYSFFVTDVQRDRNGVGLLPKRHFTEISIEQLEHRTSSEEDSNKLHGIRRKLNSSSQSRQTEPVNKTNNASASRNYYTNNTLDETISLKGTSTKENSIQRDTRFGFNNPNKQTATRRMKQITNVKSRSDNKPNQDQLDDILKDKTVQEDARNFQDKSSYFIEGKDKNDSTLEDSQNLYYGRKILFSNITIVYNAVPKCGSRTLQVSITNVRRTTQKRRNLFRSIPPPGHCSNEDGNSSCLISFYMSMPPHTFVRPHVPYVPLPSNYVMINMIRDPLERFISLFFFRIYGDGKISGLGGKKQNINDCVGSESGNCDPLLIPSAMSFMCGIQPACRKVTRWTLEQAKRNVERYLVVGYLEDIDSMHKVLEVLVPNQLGGLYDEYIRQKNATRLFKTKQKEPLLQSTIDILMQKLTLHYEFYNYIRAKFDRLKESLSIR